MSWTDNDKAALLRAAKDGNEERIRQLFSKDRNAAQKACDKFGNNALHIAAAFSSNEKFIQMLITEMGMQPTEKNKSGQNALHAAALQCNNAVLKYFCNQRLVWRDLNESGCKNRKCY